MLNGYVVFIITRNITANQNFPLLLGRSQGIFSALS